MTKPAMIDAMRIAVPVADSQLKMKTAPSGAGVATTGGTRVTSLSSPAIASFGDDTPLRKFFTVGRPQANTTTLRMIHGVHERSVGGREVSGVNRSGAVLTTSA